MSKGIKLSLEVDSTKGVASIKRVATAIKGLEGSFATVTTGGAAVSSSMATVGAVATTSFVSASVGASKMSKAFVGASAGSSKLSKDVTKLNAEITKYNQPLLSFLTNTKKATGAVNKNSTVLNKNSGATKKNSGATSKSGKAVKKSVTSWKKLTTAIKKHKKALTALTAVTGVAAFVTYSFAKSSARFNAQIDAFSNIAGSYGNVSRLILEDMGKLAAGAIDNAELVEKAGTAVMMGIDPRNLAEMMEIARATSRMTGQTMTKSFQDITLGVARHSRMILDNLGIVIQVKEANENYARSIGKSVKNLTEAEKKQAFLNETLRKGRELIERIGLEGMTASEKFQALEASVKNLKLSLGSSFIAVFQFALTPITSLITRLSEILDRINDMVNGDKLPKDWSPFEKETTKGETTTTKQPIQKRFVASVLSFFSSKEEEAEKKRIEKIMEERGRAAVIAYKKGQTAPVAAAMPTLSMERRAGIKRKLDPTENDIINAEKRAKESIATIKKLTKISYKEQLATLEKRYKKDVKLFDLVGKSKIKLTKAYKLEKDKLDKLEAARVKVETDKATRALQDKLDAIRDYNIEWLELNDQPRKAEEDRIEAWYDKELQKYAGQTEALEELKDLRDAKMAAAGGIKSDAEKEKETVIKDFRAQHDALGKTKFELQQEDVDKEKKGWEKAGRDETEIKTLYAAKSKEISLAKTTAELGHLSTLTGGMASTFQQIAEAGGKQSKKAFLMYKASAIATAGIQTAMAILGVLSEPLIPVPAKPAFIGVIAALAGAQTAMIASAKPPSYDVGGISNAKGVYQTGNIREAHVPIPSGKIPVKLSGAGGISVTNNISLYAKDSSNKIDDRKQADEIATVIEERVKRILVNERRSGGILGR